MSANPFHEYYIDELIIGSFYREVRKIVEKYGKKAKEIKKIENSFKGLNSFEISNKVREFVLNDPDLSEVYKNKLTGKAITKRMAKQIFKECFNEILDETAEIDVTDGKEVVKTKRMKLAEKIVNGVMNDTLDAVSLKGFEVIRDTVGEKPTTEIINKGIQAKIIDINASKEKIAQVKEMLDGLKGKTVVEVLEGKNGFEQDNSIRRGSEESRNERDSETDVLSKFQRVHNAHLLLDKQD